MSYLGRTRPGKLQEPVRLIVYGPPGTGKSTFAAEAPDSFYIDTDRRTGHLDIPNRFVPTSWTEVMGALTELYNNPGQYKHVVIDTLDAMEDLMHKHICQVNNCAVIEDVDGGFGKGYSHAIREYARFGAVIDALRDKGIASVMVAHPMFRTVANPVGDNYDMWDLKLKGGPKTNAADYMKARVDLIGFAHFEDFAKKAGKNDRSAKAVTTGERVLTFEHHPAFATKQGIPFPGEIPLSWKSYEEALQNNKG